MKNLRKILVIVFIIILAFGIYIETRGSYLEYKELGENYLSIFKTNVICKYSIMALNFILIFLVTYFANRGIKKGLKVFFEQEKKEMPKFPNKSIALVIAVISSIVVSNILTPKFILCASNVSFEKTDLVFNLDISFYMFIEPLIKLLLNYFIGVFVALILYSAVYYIVVFNRNFDGIDKETLKESYLVKHIIRYVRFLSIGFALLTLVKTLDIVFNGFIKTNNGLQLTGAGKTDVVIKTIGNILFAIVIIVSIFLATTNLKKNERTKLIKHILIIPTYLVCMFIVMLGYDLIFVNPNEYDKEKQYIERNLSYTKEAYGINVEDDTIQYSGTITTEEIKNNDNILNNAVIIDKDMALKKLNDNQSQTGYYTYKTAGIVKYTKNDKNTLIYVSPKEIAGDKRTYNSKTFEYTHGYGALLISATDTNNDGEIKYITDSEYIKKPQIYYGINTNNAVAVGETNQKEYDYTDNKGIEHTNSYDGNSGLTLGLLDRLILGIKTHNTNLAFSSGITEKTKVLVNRNIIKRAKLVLSEVLFDEEPYIVVNNQKEMYWVLDGYTISSNYPYSTYTNIRYNGERKDINYIRNSIKVIINCYDGNMKFYITDTTDPIAMAYHKMYPKVFENLDSTIPEDIAKDFVYPKFLYDVQSSMLEEYHNTKSEVLYRGDDSWEKAQYIATQNNKTISTKLDSYYTMVNGEKIGLVQMYTPSKKQNLTGYLVGTVEDGKNKLKISRLSSDENILGLVQLDSKISNDNNMKKEIDSLDITGAKITKRIMVVPVKNTLLCIEQIYQTKTNETNTPLLKKVIVASGNKMAIGDNLKEALESLVSQEATSIDTYTTDNVDDLIQSVIKANKNLTDSMNSKDWDIIGSDIKALQELIDKLEIQKKKEDEQKNKTNTNITNTNSTTENNIVNVVKNSVN